MATLALGYFDTVSYGFFDHFLMVFSFKMLFFVVFDHFLMVLTLRGGVPPGGYPPPGGGGSNFGSEGVFFEKMEILNCVSFRG